MTYPQFHLALEKPQSERLQQNLIFTPSVMADKVLQQSQLISYPNVVWNYIQVKVALSVTNGNEHKQSLSLSKQQANFCFEQGALS